MHRDPRDSGRMHRDSQGFLSGILRDSCLGILRDSVGILRDSRDPRDSETMHRDPDRDSRDS